MTEETECPSLREHKAEYQASQRFLKEHLEQIRNRQVAVEKSMQNVEDQINSLTKQIARMVGAQSAGVAVLSGVSVVVGIVWTVTKLSGG